MFTSKASHEFILRYVKLVGSTKIRSPKSEGDGKYTSDNIDSTRGNETKTGC